MVLLGTGTRCGEARKLFIKADIYTGSDGVGQSNLQTSLSGLRGMSYANGMQGVCRGNSKLTPDVLLIAFQLKQPPARPTGSAASCSLCAPMPSVTKADSIPSVMVFPMRKEKKVSRVEEEVVSVVEWRDSSNSRKWLFIKRPENGEHAGCFRSPC